MTTRHRTSSLLVVGLAGLLAATWFLFRQEPEEHAIDDAPRFGAPLGLRVEPRVDPIEAGVIPASGGESQCRVVSPGKTSRDFGTITLDLGTSVAPHWRGGQPEVILDTEQEQPLHGALPHLLSPVAGELDVRRVRLPPDGRVVFTYVAPGRYTLTLPRPASDGGLAYRRTKAFSVTPGDDLLLRTLD